MSQIKATLYVSVLAFSLSLSGCGDTNSKVVFNPESGKHLPGWATGHKNSAKADTESCFECHGDNLDGGIAKVSCTECHIGGNGSYHPGQWGEYAYARHKAYVNGQKSPANPNGTLKCSTAYCHGAALTGIANISPSCVNACHLGGAAAIHPVGWTQNQPYSVHADYVKAKQYDSSSCSTRRCHGTDAKGVFLSGPSCFTCHPADPTVLAPVPDKHPHNLLINGSFRTTHKQYINANGVASCWTTFCHGTNGSGVVGSGQSCSISVGCHD